MRADRGVAWALCGAMGMVVLYGFWSTIDPPLCEARVFTEAVNKGDATWCAEFWLNRYQTLIGALAAIAAAFGAWSVGMRQLQSAQDGIAIARRQAATAVLDNLLIRRELMLKAIDVASQCEVSIRQMDYRALRRRLSMLGDAFRNEDSYTYDVVQDFYSEIDRLDPVVKNVGSSAAAVETMSNNPSISGGMRTALTQQAIRARGIAAYARKIAEKLRAVRDEAGSYDGLFRGIDKFGAEVERGAGSVTVDLQRELSRLQHLIDATIEQIDGGAP